MSWRYSYILVGTYGNYLTGMVHNWSNFVISAGLQDLWQSGRQKTYIMTFLLTSLISWMFCIGASSISLYWPPLISFLRGIYNPQHRAAWPSMWGGRIFSGEFGQCHGYSDPGFSLRQSINSYVGIIHCLCRTNERRRFILTSSPIGWAHTQNDPRSDSINKVA